MNVLQNTSIFIKMPQERLNKLLLSYERLI
jgi:hypothetical protein